ncbi:MAG TPA: TonB-dependent receptor, partial [Candidatus Elarobacter sp.]|nr:TonB-dependent receptor [Candidatus Elarobacter sp.]
MHEQPSLRRIVSLLITLALATLAGAAPARAQVGTTADLIVGRVVGPDTLPLRGARVDVTSVESGITRTRPTGDDGRFAIVFPDGGGQYVVTVHYLGMRPTRTLVRRQADEDRLVANVQLAEAPVVLSAVNVDAKRNTDTLAAGAGALGQVLTRELLDQLGYLGNEAAALALITPGVTLMQGADSSMSAISIAGQPASQTGHLVDGTQSGGGALPREAVKSTNVITSTYDVSYGQFTGGFTEQSTVSGTNAVRGSLTSSTPLAPIATPGGTGVIDQRQSGFDVGGNLAGPLRKDHLFASLAAHESRYSSAGASLYAIDPATLDRMGVAPDSVARFLQILNAAGIARPPDYDGGRRGNGNRQLFGRLDFTPSERHTLTLSANESKFWTFGWSNGLLSTPLSGSQYLSDGWRTSAALTSHLGAWVNDARVGVSGARNGSRARLSATSGIVVIPSSQATPSGAPGIASLTFGGNPYASQIYNTSTIDAKDELSWLSSDGAHRV